MRTNRVHLPGPLTANARCRISGNPANHVARVLRLRVGDPLTVFDGTGGEFPATIDELSKDAVTVTLAQHDPIERESTLSITLVQALARGERTDWIMQKATELGAARIVPLASERSVVRLDADQAQARLKHWRAIVIAACEQCGRNRLPEVTVPMSLAECLSAELASEAPSASLRLVLSPGATLRVRDLEGRPGRVTVLVGPEGGLSQAEQQAAEHGGFRPLALGPRILRTETAAITMLAALQERLGDA